MTIHQQFTTESQELQIMEGEIMLNALQERVMEEGYRMLGKKRIEEL